jgi:hypothetical protein
LGTHLIFFFVFLLLCQSAPGATPHMVDEVVPDSLDSAETPPMKRKRRIGVVSNLAQEIETDLDSNQPMKKLRIRRKNCLLRKNHSRLC